MKESTSELSAAVLLEETFNAAGQQEFGKFPLLPHPELLPQMPRGTLYQRTMAAAQGTQAPKKRGEEEPKPASCPCSSCRQ